MPRYALYDDAMEDFRAQAQLERARARHVCPECRYIGGSHALGCPNEPDEPENDENDADYL